MKNKYIPDDKTQAFTTYIHQVKGLQESLAEGEDHNRLHIVATLQEMLDLQNINSGDICVVENEQKTYMSISENNGHMTNWQLLSSPSTTTYVVDKDAEMLVISPINKGDICIRPDLESTFINVTGNNGTMNDWEEFSFPVTNHKHIYKTIVDMLNTPDGEIKEGDICLVYEDPDKTKNGDYHVLVDNPSSFSQVLYVGVDNKDIIYTVDNLADMIQLPAHQGDVCYRSDIQTTYKNKGGSNRTLSDWQEMGSKVVISEVATKADRDTIQNIKTGDICIVSDIASTFIVDKNDVWKKVLAPVKISADSNNYLEVGSDDLPYVNGLAIEQHLGGNLWYNGDGGLEDNTNFPHFEYSKKYHKIGKGGMYRLGKSMAAISPRTITIDIKHDYSISTWLMSPTVLNARHHFLLVAQYDVDGNKIENWMGKPASFNMASKTKLRLPWKPGNTTMHVEDLSGWTDADTKMFLLYPYFSKEGVQYPDYEYSRHQNKYSGGRPSGSWRPYHLYKTDTLNPNDHKLTIDSVSDSHILNPNSADGSWPAGTPIVQTYRGASFYYPWIGKPSKVGEWIYVRGYFDHTKFWYGLNRVKLGFLPNYISEYIIGTNDKTDPSDVAFSGIRFVETDELVRARASHGIYDIELAKGAQKFTLDVMDEAFQYNTIRFSGGIDAPIEITISDTEKHLMRFINDTTVDITISNGAHNAKILEIVQKGSGAEVITKEVKPDLTVGIIE